MWEIAGQWKILGPISKGRIKNPGPMGRELGDSRDHVYGGVDRYKNPCVTGGWVWLRDFKFMHKGEGGFQGLFIGGWWMRDLWVHV